MTAASCKKYLKDAAVWSFKAYSETLTIKLIGNVSKVV